MSESVDSLKQRLVGAFVILSLAVIFLPMLFDKPHREGVAQVELVPPKPELETVVIKKPNSVVRASESSETESQNPDERTPQLVPAQTIESSEKSDDSESAQVAETKATSEPPKVKPENSPAQQETPPKVYSNVWMVQLGTFSKSENAYKLRDRLRGMGIDGHTKPINSGSAIRVFAGPFVTKKEALRIKRKVDAEFKLESLVVFFEA